MGKPMPTKFHTPNDFPSQMLLAFTTAPITREGECLVWRGPLDKSGYGAVRGFEDGSRTFCGAHRMAYIVANGSIRPGYVVDHLCRNRACVNPTHLEAVENVTNLRRGMAIGKTHCANGHAMTVDNTRTIKRSDGYDRRVCKTCAEASRIKYRARLRAA